VITRTSSAAIALSSRLAVALVVRLWPWPGQESSVA
jgi:hypothetical protein